MEELNFTFKKNRTIGDLISDYIALFKLIFKHFNKNILTIVLPLMAVAIIITFAMLGGRIGMGAQRIFNPILLFASVSPLFSAMSLINLVIAAFGIEYMFLLESRKSLDFTIQDIWKQFKLHFVKYILFFLSSLVVGLILVVPLAIVAAILALIPLIGMVGLVTLFAMVVLYFNCALFLYLQGRSKLWESYRAGFSLMREKMFSYGLASFIFQFIGIVLLGILTIVPEVILGIIAFNTVGFDNMFMTTFAGKLIIALGIGIIVCSQILFTIYVRTFNVLQYFSLLEVHYREETLDDIDQIGEIGNER